MKTTKIVEIEICDLCGLERYSLRPCASCGIELCSACTVRFKIDITRVESHPQSHNNLRSETHIPQDVFGEDHYYNETYCRACSSLIDRNLRAVGFVPKAEAKERRQRREILPRMAVSTALDIKADKS